MPALKNNCSNFSGKNLTSLYTFMLRIALNTYPYTSASAPDKSSRNFEGNYSSMLKDCYSFMDSLC